MSTYEISKSSLLSLKAEILRKQEDLAQARIDNKAKLKTIKKNSHLFLKNKGVEERNKKDIPVEEQNLLDKSRKALEAKAKLYNQLVKHSSSYTEDDTAELNKRYLVQFDKKVGESSSPEDQDAMEIEKSPEYIEEDNGGDYEEAVNSDEEWVEYVDCLGRTRTCLKKDLSHLKEDDKSLEKEVQRRRENNTPANIENIDVDRNTTEGVESKTDEGQPSAENELLSADMSRELLRQKWEKEEEELRKKTSIHYQDLLFDEARSHGVGYFAFSKDEEERANQQEALKKIREETQQQQKKMKELKALRDKQMAVRLKAARNRKRARMGLPPEEDEPAPEEPKVPEEKEEKVSEPQKSEEEKAREDARSKHIRPWDIGKEGVKEHYVYSQEEWVDKKRNERPTEFAPPTAYRNEFRSALPDSNLLCEPENKSLHFSTIRPQKPESHNRLPLKKKSLNPYKNDYYEQPKQQEPIPIISEYEETGDDRVSDLKDNFVQKNIEDSRKGTEIPPPPTYDYYGPSGTKKPKPDSSKISLEDSINAGLQILRKQVESKHKSKRDQDSMFIM